MMPRNRLAAEASPYLLQHADNPVDWWPWGEDALAEAQRTGKPILLSVGYAACHWCHVMAHECFENPEIAALMNRLFVNIKVDREERPDLDHIYQSALALMGQAGGWPLTIFLTPQGEPFWGGTFFPAAPRYGRPGFIQVLEKISEIYRTQQDVVERRRRKTSPPMSTRSMAASVRRRNFPSPSCSSSSGVPICGRATQRFATPSPARSIISARAGSTIISAAALRAMRWMRAGRCRISRRCSMTMRSSCGF